MTKDEASGKLFKDAAANAAAGHNQMKLVREDGLENVIANVPRWRNTRPK